MRVGGGGGGSAVTERYVAPVSLMSYHIQYVQNSGKYYMGDGFTVNFSDQSISLGKLCWSMCFGNEMRLIDFVVSGLLSNPLGISCG